MAKDLESVRGAIEILRMCKTNASKLKELETSARDAIEEAMGEEEIGKLDGEVVITWTHSKRRQFQQKKMAEEHPEIAVEFTELTETRTFKLVDPA